MTQSERDWLVHASIVYLIAIILVRLLLNIPGGRHSVLCRDCRGHGLILAPFIACRANLVGRGDVDGACAAYRRLSRGRAVSAGDA